MIPVDEHGRTIRSGNKQIENPEERLLDKLGKLKRMSEGAKEIGNEEEARRFADMFQRLVIANKLDMTDVEFKELDHDEPIQAHYIDYKKYPEIKMKRRRSEWLQSLGHVVAEAHFCRILVHPGSSRITLVGRKSDTEVAEFVLVTLQRAVEKMAHKAYYAYWFELFVICKHCGGAKDGHNEPDHKFESSTHKASGFKASWISSFVDRLAQRYREERQGHAGNSTALVRINRAEKDVIDWIKENVKKNAEGLARHSKVNSEGHRQGRAAADQLNLGNPKVVKASAPQKRLEGSEG